MRFLEKQIDAAETSGGSPGWFGYLVRRLATLILVVVGVVTLVFVVQRMVPGDPVDVMLGEHATLADRQEMRSRLGLDRSAWDQYWLLWQGVLDGSLGTSFEPGERAVSVSSVIARHVPATVELAIGGLLFAIVIAFPLGIAAALKPNTWIDTVTGFLALAGLTIPNFWLGPLLIYLFCVHYSLFPDPGAQGTGVVALILPSFVLGTALSGKLMRMLRSSLLEIRGEPFVMAAQLRGIPPIRVFLRHVLRPALIPVVTVIGLQFASLLTGALVTEKVFARPGIGTLLLDAVSGRNYPLVQGLVIGLAVVYAGVNLITDLVYAWLDPRVRLIGSGSFS
ncbi:MAG: ABC transporter permease [Myxococcales bacterium]|nr:ABC transporter permease [Myxococcales bacterium]